MDKADRQKDHFVEVLLEGDGRMVRSFDHLTLTEVRCWAPQEGFRGRYASFSGLPVI